MLRPFTRNDHARPVFSTIVILSMLLLVTLPSLAQDVPTPADISLSETFTSLDELFSLRYPAGWQVEDFNVVGDPHQAAFGLVFSVPAADTQVMVIVTDVTGELAYPDNLNTPAEMMDGARNGDELVVGPLNTLLEQGELRVGDLDAVKLVIEGETGTSLQVFCALNDQWMAMLNIQADNPALPAQYEAAGIAVLASLRFALGESFIAAPVFHAELPEHWVFYTSDQEAGYYRFGLRPRGDLSFQGDRIVIVFSDLTGGTFLNTIRLEGLEAGLALIISGDRAYIETEVENLTFAGYDAVTAGAKMGAYPDAYYQYVAGMIDESWLFLVIGVARDESADGEPAVADLISDAEAIIEGAELTLPPA